MMIITYIDANTGCHQFLVNAGASSGPVGDSLRIIDVPMTGLLSKHPTVPGSGYVQYLGSDNHRNRNSG